MTADPYTRGMAALGSTVALGSMFAPARLLRLFGLPKRDASGAALLGWRLMGIRTATVSVLAARGDKTAQAVFLPVQVMDQAAWWWGYRRGQLPLRTAALAATASGVLIGLDLKRRTA